MISATTAKGTKVWVDYVPDSAPNRGGYYCQVHLDGVFDDEVDNFVIHADCIKMGSTIKGCIEEYNNGVTEY